MGDNTIGSVGNAPVMDATDRAEENPADKRLYTEPDAPSGSNLAPTFGAPATLRAFGPPPAHAWTADMSSLFAGIDNLKIVTNPATVSAQAAFDKSESYEKALKKGISGADARGFFADARSEVTNMCEEMRKQQGLDSVWLLGDVKLPKAMQTERKTSAKFEGISHATRKVPDKTDKL